MSFTTIMVETAGAVATLTLNRPGARNALNRQAVAEIAEAARWLDQDPDIRVVVLTATPPVFCAGLDLKEALPRDLATLQSEGFGDREAIARLRKPVIAAATGAAYGAGCELALMSDIILAGKGARFCQPEVSRGGMPGAGGTQRLARLVGPMRAKELCLTGRVIDASEAQAIGLVLEAVDDAELMPRAMALAADISRARPYATMAIKQSFNAAAEVGLSQGLLIERQLSYGCIASRHEDANHA